MRKCSNCGADTPEGARFCANCGVALPLPPVGSLEGAGAGSFAEPPPPDIPTAPVVSPISAAAPTSFSGVGEPPTSGLAVASLISGVLGWVALPCIGGATAVVTGHMARAEIQKSQGKKGGAGLAMAGLVLGYAQVALLCLVLTLIGALFAVGGNLKDSFMQALDQAQHGQKVEEGPPTDEGEYPDEVPEEESPDDSSAADPNKGDPSGDDLPTEEVPGRSGEKAY